MNQSPPIPDGLPNGLEQAQNQPQNSLVGSRGPCPLSAKSGHSASITKSFPRQSLTTVGLRSLAEAAHHFTSGANAIYKLTFQANHSVGGGQSNEQNVVNKKQRGG